jgi:hypothetical protein
MTDLERARDELRKAEDRLLRAIALLGRCEANLAVDNKLGIQSDEREATILAVRQFVTGK